MVLTRIAGLAAQIQENTTKLDNYLQSKDLPSPSFDEDGPVDFGIESEEIAKARERAREASLELHDLLLGPALCLRPILNGVSLQTIYKYNIAHHVPLHGEISFKELSIACGLDEVNLRRSLRFAMAFHHVFQEPRKGVVRHSAASRRLVESPDAQDALGYMFDEVWQSLAHTVEAHEKFKSDEPNKSGWSLAQQTDKSAWEYYESHPAMANRFSGAMSAFFNGIGNSPSFLLANYPWASLGGPSKKAVVVDVGGSRGDISIMLAQSFPNLRCVVQDLPQTIQGAESNVPLELQERMKFIAHDAFKEQPVEADAYLFRMVFHDWSDAHVIRMLEATVPALKPGARIIVNDHLIPEPNTLSWSKERQIRSMDILMWSLFNSRERDDADWRMLFAQADERFKDIRIWLPEGATMAIIEAIWEG